jgi:hypothetical protein
VQSDLLSKNLTKKFYFLKLIIFKREKCIAQVFFFFKVRNFHKKFYRAENLTVILTGQIAADDVFKALAVVEDDIIAKVMHHSYINNKYTWHVYVGDGEQPAHDNCPANMFIL